MNSTRRPFEASFKKNLCLCEGPHTGDANNMPIPLPNILEGRSSTRRASSFIATGIDAIAATEAGGRFRHSPRQKAASKRPFRRKRGTRSDEALGPTSAEGEERACVGAGKQSFVAPDLLREAVEGFAVFWRAPGRPTQAILSCRSESTFCFSRSSTADQEKIRRLITCRPDPIPIAP
jgi:hypothetical protein